MAIASASAWRQVQDVLASFKFWQQSRCQAIAPRREDYR
jgi:hypothetical protein